MTKTSIYLIRHGECAGNKENRVRGRVDFPLNENVMAQAEALALAMMDKGLAHVYSSPLKGL
jgi:broad specificity phosphatase PhoE